jgi:DNA-directed RNA polymerase subunit H (RpoH/RPB5)
MMTGKYYIAYPCESENGTHVLVSGERYDHAFNYAEAQSRIMKGQDILLLEVRETFHVEKDEVLEKLETAHSLLKDMNTKWNFLPRTGEEQDAARKALNAVSEALGLYLERTMDKKECEK